MLKNNSSPQHLVLIPGILGKNWKNYRKINWERKKQEGVINSTSANVGTSSVPTFAEVAEGLCQLKI
jgi:hypothetical protein